MKSFVNFGSSIISSLYKQDIPKQCKTANKLNIFPTKEMKSSIFLKVCDLKMFFLKCLLICLKIYSYMVTYKLQKTIRFKLFNHKNLVESFNNNFLNQNERNLSCHCENSVYIDPEHGPILTRDLQIARNNKLWGLITEGPKYGEPSTIC